MLTIDNLSYHINNKILFSDISLSIYAGSLVVIKGKNGGGKTSLLELIAGLKKPKSGLIYWCHQNLKINLNDIMRIHYISHNIAVKKCETVRDNLLFWSKLNDSKDSLQAAINYFGLEEILDVECRYLSAGWQKRVALARLLCSNAQIWILDEPDCNLDDKTINLLINCINIAVQRGMIVFIATHHLEQLQPHFIIDIDSYA
jgi:heme exporter protein A